MTKEVQEISSQWGIPDVTMRWRGEPTKVKWKSIIKDASKEKNEKELKERIKKFDKLEAIKDENFGRKEYLEELTLEKARINFKLRSRMLKCKLNYSSEKSNVNSSWRCDSCMRMVQLSIESQPHILVCPAYKELRVGKSLESIEDLTEYYAQVMKIRDKLSFNC